MQRKYKIIAGVIVVMLIGLISLTIAYFTLNIYGNPTEDTIVVTSKDLRLTFSDNDQSFNLANIQPGALSIKTITVKNDGSDTTYYTLKFENLVNSFTNNELVYRASCVSYTNYGVAGQAVSGTCGSYSNTPLTNSANPITQTIGTDLAIGVGITHEYIVTIEFLNVNANQNYNQNASMAGRIVIEESLTATSLAGFVRDASGAPVANVQLAFDANSVTSTTDSNGYFYLNNVIYGDVDDPHDFTVSASDSSWTDTVSITLNNQFPSNVTYANGIYDIDSLSGSITNLVVVLDNTNHISSITLYTS